MQTRSRERFRPVAARDAPSSASIQRQQGLRCVRRDPLCLLRRHARLSPLCRCDSITLRSRGRSPSRWFVPIASNRAPHTVTSLMLAACFAAHPSPHAGGHGRLQRAGRHRGGVRGDAASRFDAHAAHATDRTYGVVLKCVHMPTGRLVAVKQFKESEEDEEVWARAARAAPPRLSPRRASPARQVRRTAMREISLLQVRAGPARACARQPRPSDTFAPVSFRRCSTITWCGSSTCFERDRRGGCTWCVRAGALWGAGGVALTGSRAAGVRAGRPHRARRAGGQPAGPAPGARALAHVRVARAIAPVSIAPARPRPQGVPIRRSAV